MVSTIMFASFLQKIIGFMKFIPQKYVRRMKMATSIFMI